MVPTSVAQISDGVNPQVLVIISQDGCSAKMSIEVSKGVCQAHRYQLGKLLDSGLDLVDSVFDDLDKVTDATGPTTQLELPIANDATEAVA